jgi:hypothetical protein
LSAELTSGLSTTRAADDFEAKYYLYALKALMKFTTPSACSFVLTIALTFCILLSRAQTSLNGSYVATKINYLNGDELQDDNLLKYTYVKYTFSNGNQRPFQVSIMKTAVYFHSSSTKIIWL